MVCIARLGNCFLNFAICSHPMHENRQVRITFIIQYLILYLAKPLFVYSMKVFQNNETSQSEAIPVSTKMDTHVRVSG